MTEVQADAGPELSPGQLDDFGAVLLGEDQIEDDFAAEDYDVGAPGSSPKDGEKQAQKEPQALVEIKPRKREPDSSRETRSSLDKSAFDEVPPAEVYDPSWNTNPLRCEAGQLGKSGTGPSEPAGPGPVLPGAFTLHSSADLDDDEDDEGGTAGNANAKDVQREALSALATPRAKYSISRKSVGGISFLGRKKKETPFSVELFQFSDAADTVSKRSQSVLVSSFNADIVPGKPGQIRFKIKIVEPNATPRFVSAPSAIILFIESTDSGHRVTLRRSKGDKGRASQEAFFKFATELAHAYRDQSEDPGLKVTLAPIEAPK